MKALLSVKTDIDIKTAAKKVAEDLGLSLSAIVNASLKQFVRNRELYLSTAPTMSAYLENMLGNIDFDIANGKNLSRPFSSAKEVTDYLRSNAEK